MRDLSLLSPRILDYRQHDSGRLNSDELTRLFVGNGRALRRMADIALKPHANDTPASAAVPIGGKNAPKSA